ncbi:DUF817 domain-containing protein [Roseobacter sp. HKCCA0434]|uniref:DUF817 domain-containing protein n=1 Tax=Roseobacter sp. HKCCA0434 TaxID=3079297 RepID=UPI002905AE40|nr:DUF817 domain-containing protein [Roseobacter sp. HKCCA0434]
MGNNPSQLAIERRLGDWMRPRLPDRFAEFVMFGLKQGWACLFGGLMLALLIGTHLVWRDAWGLSRYDFLVTAAVAIQVLFLATGLESWREAGVIVLFHVSGTIMEVFKLRMGSWDYPDTGVLEIAGVPLFSGFMYASVGSYMARVIRLFDMRFAPYPPEWLGWLLGLAIYLNFFWHHFGPDLRYLLMGATVLVFGRTWVEYTVTRRHRMPLVLAAGLSTIFLWLAESVGTATGTWVYAGQADFGLAPIAKAGSWYLLLYVSFVQVAIVYRDRLQTRENAG